MKPGRWQAHAAMLLTVMIWGVSYVLMKLALREIEPLAVTLFRYMIASLGYGIVLAAGRYNLPKVARGDWFKILVCAATLIVGYGGLVSFGVQNSTASVAALLNSSGPVFTLILSGLFLKETLTRNKTLGIGIALFGVVIVVLRGSGNADLTMADVMGPAIVVVAMFLWAVSSVVSKPLLGAYSAISFSAGVMTIGTLIMLPALALVNWQTIAVASPIVWIAMAYIGLLSTLLGQLLCNYALSVVDTSQMAVYLYLIPMTTVISASLFLGETVTIYFFLGGALIVTGVTLTNRAGSRAKQVVGVPE